MQTRSLGAGGNPRVQALALRSPRLIWPLRGGNETAKATTNSRPAPGGSVPRTHVGLQQAEARKQGARASRPSWGGVARLWPLAFSPASTNTPRSEPATVRKPVVQRYTRFTDRRQRFHGLRGVSYRWYDLILTMVRYMCCNQDLYAKMASIWSLRLHMQI